MTDQEVEALKEALRGTFVVYICKQRPVLNPRVHRATCEHVGKGGLVSKRDRPTGWYLIGFDKVTQATWAAKQCDPRPVKRCSSCLSGRH